MNDVSSVIKTLASGVVSIGLITAIALHASALAKLVKSGGQATSGLLNVAERG